MAMFEPGQQDYISKLNYLAGLVGLAQGDKGWSPQIVTVIDGARVVLQIADWVGGTGTKPTAGQFLGDGVLVTNIANAINVRGGTGPKGDKGDDGETGPSNVLTIGTVTEGPADATISGTSPSQVLNLVIPKGDKGDDGDVGPSNILTIGTVTEGPADATITGTSPSQVLNLVIPKGDKGDKGDDGDAATLTVGTVTTGAPGTGVIINNSGTSSAAVLDFTIPRGDKGDQGVKGDPGDAATITVGTVTTGAPGTNATVTNVGTSSAAVLDITIPRGDPGTGSGYVASVNGVMPDGGGNVELDPSDIGAVEEAPSNGKDHARKDGAWVEIEPGVSSWNDLTDKPAVIAAGATAADARSAIGAGTSNFDGDYNNLSNKPTIPAAQQQTDWDAVSGITSIANKPAVIAAGATQAAARTAIDAAGVSASNTFSGAQTFSSSINVLGNFVLKSNSASIQSEATSGGAFFNISAGWLGTASGVGCDLNLSSGSINNPSNTTGNGGEVYIQSGTNFFTPDKEGSIILKHGYKTPVLELPNDLSFVVNGQAGTAGQVLTSAGAGNPVAWANAPALGTAAALDVPATGDATTSQVVKGDDTRLSDSRTPTGVAGGVLSGNYPNPSFAVDMATQAELNVVAGAKLDKGYATHTDTAGDSGITWPALQFLVQKFTAAVSIAGAIRFAGIRRYEFDSSQNNSGSGHHVGGMDWYVHKGSGNPNIAIGHEAKVDIETAATISVVAATESQVSSNAGTIGNLYGHRAQITGNAGTIGTFVGYRPDVISSSGTLGEVIGLEFPDLSAFSATQRSTLVNRDPGAPILSAAPIIDQSLTYAAPSATGFTVTVPDKRQMLLLTPAAAYAAGTINFPAKSGVADGQFMEITTSQAVTAVTWGANGASYVLYGPAGLAAGQTVRFRYFAALDWWVFVSGDAPSSGDSVPPGTVVFHAANTPPAGYLKANGAAVSRSTYAALFAVIGTTYGTGDGSTTFNVPDLRGRFVRSWDDGAGRDTSRVFGSVQTDDNKDHTHGGSALTAGGHSHTIPAYGSYFLSASGSFTGMQNASTTSTSYDPGHNHSLNISSSGTESRPINIALLACIKY